MKVSGYYILTLIFVYLLTGQLQAQDESFYEDLLREEVEVENPVYKPVIAGGIGMFGFLGDVKNNQGNPFFGMPGYKVNISTFVDNNHYVKANFYFITGSVVANERSYNNLQRNLNFRSDINLFGVNLNYGFGHFVKGTKKITPFVSTGIEIMQFNSKADLLNSEDISYHYWSDGTIRNLPESQNLTEIPSILRRDYSYETDLRDEVDWGYGEYEQQAIVIPVDIGLDFTITDRIMIRAGASVHYTFTDYLDHLAPDNNQNIKANNLHDMFTYTYVTFHFDLFSEAKTYTVEKLFADYEFDYTLFEDEDNDMVFDHADECPDTPLNVAVDSLGCPYDDDNDGVPNYRDQEKNTPEGAYVDENGVELSDDELIALLDNSTAVNRKEIDLYIQNIESITYSKYFGISNLQIPDKFKQVDLDNDGYISFDEVLDTIDDFFDFQSTLTTEDIYELNEFFFAQ